MKNQAKLKNMGLDKEVRYYYMRFGEGADNAPDGYLGVATVCLLKCGGMVHRGIAFCSPLDQFNKKLGRNIALGRAIKAMEWRCCGEAIPQKTPAGILKKHNFDYLSTFNAGLTEYERKLILPDLIVVADGRWDDRKGEPVED